MIDSHHRPGPRTSVTAIPAFAGATPPAPAAAEDPATPPAATAPGSAPDGTDVAQGRPALRRARDSSRLWPEQLRVTAWNDPLVDRFGHDPRSEYVELFWLGVLGPSTVWLLRRIAGLLQDNPNGVTIDLEDTAGALGVGGRAARHAPLQRSLDRCVSFGMAQRSATALAVRRRLPPLAHRHLVRLPLSVQQRHHQWIESQCRGTVQPGEPEIDMCRRARQLALSLVQLGEDRLSVEQQLARWKIHPAVAHAAADWAAARQRPLVHQA